MYFLEVFIGDMGVDLCRGDGRVSEHRLDAADIRTVREEIGREGVSKRVRMDILDDAGLGGIVLDDTFDTPWCQTDILVFVMNRELLRGKRNEERRSGIRSFVQIPLERSLGGWRNEDDTELVSFAADRELFFFQVDMLAIKICEFGDTESGRKEELKYGSVT